MSYSNGDGGMNGNAAGKDVVEQPAGNSWDRPVAPKTWV